MVAMPQEKALALLPDLRSPERIEAAVTEIFTAIEHKEAVLMGYPIVCTTSGQRSTSEAVLEKRYPTEFSPPQIAGTFASGSTAASGEEHVLPTAFESRNCGATLEVEPVVRPGGDWIDLNLVPQRVALMGFDGYEYGQPLTGKILKIEQPQFFTTKIITSTLIRNGQRTLLGVHKLLQPENHIEFFILQAVATPVR